MITVKGSASEHPLMKPALLLLLMAPVLPAAAGDWIDLLPDESLKGWIRVPIPAVSGVDARPQWKVDPANRTLTCTGSGGHEWLMYEKELGDYDLSVEWRFTPKEGNPRYNSGIGIRLSKAGELWLQAQTGQAGGYLFGTNFANGAIQRVNTLKEVKENRVKAVVEWNLYEIQSRGDTVTLSINGAVVSVVPGVGLRRGFIGLEAEGFEVAFRNLKLKTVE
jgi:hypothetical protein